MRILAAARERKTTNSWGIGHCAVRVWAVTSDWDAGFLAWQ
jgi:hypothetical protein